MILARNPAWMGPKPARPRALLSYLLQYARNATRYACAWLRECRPAGKYAAACCGLEGATPASVRQTCSPARSVTDCPCPRYVHLYVPLP